MSDPSVGGAVRTVSSMDDADQAVLRAIGAGRLDALEELYERHKTMAYSIAYRITGDASLAEDVVQDAFLGAWRGASGYAVGRGSVKTWIMSIVHHRAIDAVRRRRPVAELPDPNLPAPDVLTSPDVWPEVAGRLDAVEVRAALDTLTDVQREAIELAYFSGLTQSEVAERTGAPLGTVKSRMRLGLLAMRDALLAAERSVEAQQGRGAQQSVDAQRGPGPDRSAGS